MATRTWFGGTGNWFTAVDWVTAGGSLAPQPDDSLIVGTGTVTLATNASLVQGAFDAESVTLGGGNTQFATLIATSATFGARFSLTRSPPVRPAAISRSPRPQRMAVRRRISCCAPMGASA
jgi:hypothetical protein